MRDRQGKDQRKSAPVVAFYAGSLTGVTAPSWEVEGEVGLLYKLNWFDPRGLKGASFWFQIVKMRN